MNIRRPMQEDKVPHAAQCESWAHEKKANATSEAMLFKPLPSVVTLVDTMIFLSALAAFLLSVHRRRDM